MSEDIAGNYTPGQGVHYVQPTAHIPTVHEVAMHAMTALIAKYDDPAVIASDAYELALWMLSEAEKAEKDARDMQR
jgi:hypothetical protein